MYDVAVVSSRDCRAQVRRCTCLEDNGRLDHAWSFVAVQSEGTYPKFMGQDNEGKGLGARVTD